MGTPKSQKKRTAKKGGKVSGLTFPSGRIGSILRKGRYADRVSQTAAVYLSGVVSYLTTELLELSTKAMKKGQSRLNPRAVSLAVDADAELGSLLSGVSFAGGGSAPRTIGVLFAKHPKKKKTNAGKRAKTTTGKVKAVAKKAVTAKGKGKVVKAKAAATGDDTLAVGGITISGGGLSREESNDAKLLYRRGSTTHKWQFWDDGNKWSDYDDDASQAVELAHASWLVNPHIDVRSVKSGFFEYMVDFNMMQQQNVKHPNHKIRKIRRVANL